MAATRATSIRAVVDETQHRPQSKTAANLEL